MWEWRGPAQDEGDSVANWLSEFLGRPVRLMRYIGETEKIISAVRCVLVHLHECEVLDTAIGT